MVIPAATDGQSGDSTSFAAPTAEEAKCLRLLAWDAWRGKDTSIGHGCSAQWRWALMAPPNHGVFADGNRMSLWPPLLPFPGGCNWFPEKSSQRDLVYCSQWAASQAGSGVLWEVVTVSLRFYVCSQCSTLKTAQQCTHEDVLCSLCVLQGPLQPLDNHS